MSSISNYPVLVIEYPDNRSETWWLNHDEVTLGRSRECSIVIHSDLVSRKHIRIQKKDNYCFVEDLKSTNGTRINGMPAKEPRRLHNNDQIILSNSVHIWFVEDFQNFLMDYADDDTRPVMPITDGDIPKVSQEDTLPPTDSLLFTSSFNRPKNIPPIPKSIPDLSEARADKTLSVKLSPAIFVSYSRDDWWHYAWPVVQLLREKQFNVWIDQELIQGGEDWLDTINKALADCSCLVLCVTPQALRSKYVKIEYRYFLDKGKPIVPLICEESELPAELMRIQTLSFGDLDSLISVLQKNVK